MSVLKKRRLTNAETDEQKRLQRLTQILDEPLLSRDEDYKPPPLSAPILKGKITAWYPVRGEGYIRRQLASGEGEFFRFKSTGIAPDAKDAILQRHFQLKVQFCSAGKDRGYLAADHVSLRPDGNYVFEERPGIELLEVTRGTPEHLLKLQQRLDAAKGQEAAHDLLAEVCMALPAPRLPKNGTEQQGSRMDQKAVDRLREGIPSKLRVWLAQELRRINFRDDALSPILSEPLNHLEDMIKVFELQTGKDIAEAQAGKQWKQLKDILEKTSQAATVDSAQGDSQELQAEELRVQRSWGKAEHEQLLLKVETATKTKIGSMDKANAHSQLSQKDWQRIGKEMGGRSSNSCRKAYLKLTDERYSTDKTGFRHDKGIIKTMVNEALKKLGGEGTVPEIIEICKEDRELQAKYINKLGHEQTKISGSCVEVPMWERSIATNMHGMCKVTSKKRNGRKVYALKS